MMFWLLISLAGIVFLWVLTHIWPFSDWWDSIVMKVYAFCYKTAPSMDELLQRLMRREYELSHKGAPLGIDGRIEFGSIKARIIGQRFKIGLNKWLSRRFRERLKLPKLE